MAKAKAFAAGTIINALAALKGVAFALNLKTTVRFIPGKESDFESKALGCVAKKVFRSLKIDGKVKVESEIPRRSGLGSSSAVVNALICAAYKYLNKELEAHSILRANARISLECGMSYTGAFDDASASLLGGVVFSDNAKMKLFKRETLEGKAAVLIPDWERGNVDLRKIRERREEIERAFKLAMEGKIREAMYVNSYEYCQALNLPFEPVSIAYNLGLNAGLSGNGPSYVAFGENVKDVKPLWESFGKVILVDIVSVPAEKVKIEKSLFIRT